MRTATEHGDGDQHQPTRGVGSNPGEGPDERGRDEADDGRPEPCGLAFVAHAAHPDEDLVEAPEDGASNRDQDRPTQVLETRPHDEQHAEEASDHRQPAARADLFAKHRHRQRDDDQRRSGGNGVHIGQRQVLEGQNENAVLDHHQQGAAALQPGPPGAPDAGQTLPVQHDHRQRREQDVAKPQHLRDGELAGEHLAQAIHGGEGEHGGQRQRDGKAHVGTVHRALNGLGFDRRGGDGRGWLAQAWLVSGGVAGWRLLDPTDYSEERLVCPAGRVTTAATAKPAAKSRAATR